jgi:hypothetical protein
MASTRQVEANRRNGALGGPKTEAGKQRGKYHALQHGLCAESTVLPGESAKEFQQLREDLFQHWLPANEQERFEFEQLVIAAWRLLRVRGVETAMWSQYIVNFRQREGASPIPESAQDSHRSLAGVLCEVEDRAFNNYFRYERAIERGYYRALQQLQRTQSIRQRDARREPAESNKQPSESGIRSVPSRPPIPPVTPPAVSENGIRSVSLPDDAGAEQFARKPPHAVDQTMVSVRESQRIVRP